MVSVHPLTTFRKSNQLSLADLARQLEVSRPTVHRWESGERKISREFLSRVSGITGIPARDLRPDLAEMFEDAQ